jgi:hypothetical protein
MATATVNQESPHMMVLQEKEEMREDCPTPLPQPAPNQNR